MRANVVLGVPGTSFAQCQMLCQVSCMCTWQSLPSLSSVLHMHLAKPSIFAECRGSDTWQRIKPLSSLGDLTLDEAAITIALAVTAPFLYRVLLGYSAKSSLPTIFLSSALCQVQYVLCRVPLALGKEANTIVCVGHRKTMYFIFFSNK